MLLPKIYENARFLKNLILIVESVIIRKNTVHILRSVLLVDNKSKHKTFKTQNLQRVIALSTIQVSKKPRLLVFFFFFQFLHQICSLKPFALNIFKSDKYLGKLLIFKIVDIRYSDNQN